LKEENLKYKLALSFINGVGIHNAKNLIAYIGSVEGIFKEKKGNLLKIQGIGKITAENIIDKSSLIKAEKEIEFIKKHKIKTYFYLDNDYPFKLKQCSDAPILIYQIGEVGLNNSKILSIVGTRKATPYGKDICDNLIAGLSERGHNPIIVSGLAYGIDSHAHKSAIKNNLKTVAVLAHGLNTIYPSTNRTLAKSISRNGALITEFPAEQKAEKANFVKRNRIIAGLADATIVIESGSKGGALITADIANSYNRDVFAVPGKITDKYSEGCNKLIKINKAALIEKVEDIEYLLGWDIKKEKNKVIQKKLFNNLNDTETEFLNIIEKHHEIDIDQISILTKKPMSVVSSTLLNLEFAGFIKCLPGKIYKSTIM